MYKITFEYIKEGSAILPKGYIKILKAKNKQQVQDNIELHPKDRWKLISIEEHVIRYLNKAKHETV